MEFRPSEISIIGFLVENGIVNERGEAIDFKDRPFLYDPIRDWSRFQCYKKAAQGIGMSVTMLIKSLYAAKYKQWSLIHSFPTDEDARSFVKTKTNKILKANKCFSEIESDNIELKQFGDRDIHYQGTGSESGALSKTVDIIIQDEKDRSDQQFLKDLESRTINSEIKGVWSLSNPSIDGAGVDADWAESDKKEWFVTCKAGHAYPMTWPESIDISNAQFICAECKVPLTDDDRRRGAWVRTGDPNAKWSGYHMTLMFAPKISAEYMIEQWDGGHNPEYFNNFILGEPYSPGDTKIERHAILDNWTPKNIDTGHYYLGVDVGNVKHFVLGSEKGVLQVGTFTEWHDLDKLLMRYSPTTVMDAMPENTMAHHYKDTKDNFFICHLGGEKADNAVLKWGEDDKRGMIFAEHSRVIDRVVNDLLEGKILYSLPSDKDFRTYVKHCGDLRRVKEADKRGIEHYVWDSLTGEDHYFYATLFYWIARQTFVSGASGMINVETPKAVIQTKTGWKQNINEVLEHRALYGRDS